MWPLLIGAGVGLLDNIFKSDAADKQNNIESAKAMTNPWLHMQPQEVKRPSAITDVAGGALTGYKLGQDSDRWDKEQSVWDAIAKRMGSSDVPTESVFPSTGRRYSAQ